MSKVRKIFVILALGVGSMAWLYWGLVFSIADWLRFSSPSTPNEATGQVVYMKAVKGVFYVTADQQFWLETALLPVWLVGAISIAVFHVLRGNTVVWSPKIRTLGGICFGVIWVFWLLMFGFGDQVIALLTTGSLSLPPEPNTHLSSSPIDYMGPIVALAMFGFAAANVVLRWRRGQGSSGD